MNHVPAILAALALIYSTHQLLVVWIIVADFHFCSLLDRYTVLEVWAVRRPVRVCCGSRWGWCMLFINFWDSLTAPCLVYNMAMYTVYGPCGQYSRCVFIHWPVRGLYGPRIDFVYCLHSPSISDVWFWQLYHIFVANIWITDIAYDSFLYLIQQSKWNILRP